MLILAACGGGGGRDGGLRRACGCLAGERAVGEVGGRWVGCENYGRALGSDKIQT